MKSVIVCARRKVNVIVAVAVICIFRAFHCCCRAARRRHQGDTLVTVARLIGREAAHGMTCARAVEVPTPHQPIAAPREQPHRKAFRSRATI